MGLFACIIDNITEELAAEEWGTSSSHQSSDRKTMIKEILHYSLCYVMPTTDLEFYRKEIEPLLPWCDRTFELERVGGQPVNPGETYKEWHHVDAAESHKDEVFSHTYAERFWPSYANVTEGGKIDRKILDELIAARVPPRRGIRFAYGDVSDLIKVLVRNPDTRQAVLPIWFPEDLTAVRKRERAPCSLYYSFINRNNRLDITYTIRSCDYHNHFRDDVYLAIRLALWVLEQVKKAAPEDSSWHAVQPGVLHMHIQSLHAFKDVQK